MKKRILIVNEYSQLMTGFSTYMYYVLPYLFQTGKYEIAELATYVNNFHPKAGHVPWKFYANEPDPNNPEIRRQYDSDQANQFGKFLFDEVCLDFKPDIVISIRDHWSDVFIQESPYRKNFKWIHMPTVDGEPQKLEWVETYKKVDTLLTYSHFAKNVLERQSGDKLKVFDVASPGTDLDIFVPGKKQKNRERFGLQSDLLIVNTVMRNQPRKLFPEILRMFNIYLNLCKKNNRDDLAQRTVLHFHTTNPDLGWDLPDEIRKHNLSRKVLFTYMCEACGEFGPMYYYNNYTTCRKCNKPALRLPNTALGLERPDLADIMSIGDVYLQYSVCEGFGMAGNDAKACGLPTMQTDYSAMSEQVHCPGGIPIPVIKFAQEPINQTNQLRAQPDNEKAAQLLFDHMSKTDAEREQISRDARKWVEDHYNWTHIAQIWENAIDYTPVLPQNETWYSPPKFKQPKNKMPNNLNNEDFVYWCVSNIACDPESIYDFKTSKFIEILNQGYEQGVSPEGAPIRIGADRKKILHHFVNQVKMYNQKEQRRIDVVFNKPATKPSVNRTIV